MFRNKEISGQRRYNAGIYMFGGGDYDILRGMAISFQTDFGDLLVIRLLQLQLQLTLYSSES